MSANALIAPKEEVERLLRLQNTLDLEALKKVSIKFAREYPESPEGWKILAAALIRLRRLTDAITPLNNAIFLKPDDELVHNMLGVVFHGLGQLAKAELSYRKSIELNPNYAQAFSNLGNTLKELNRFSEAELCYREALRLRPDLAEVHNNLGITLRSLGQLNGAIASYREALRLKPNNAQTYNNLGNALKDLGNTEEAIACYKQAIRLKEDFADAHSNLIFCLTKSDKAKPGDIYNESIAFGKAISARVKKSNEGYRNEKIVGKRLRVGFVSADLFMHSVAFFLLPLFKGLQTQDEIELFVYSNNSYEDVITDQFRRCTPNWRSIVGLTDSDVCELIRNDTIDILIDLSGHTARNRLPLFALKPAPIQMSWLGSPITTGLKEIDYYIARESFLPEGQFDELYTEKIIRIPGNSFSPPRNTGPINTLPSLNSHLFTFGSFNETGKITSEVIAMWANLLGQVSGSRMLIANVVFESREKEIRSKFEALGIHSNRLDFRKRTSFENYMKIYHEVDLCLDTFPYSGSTTTYNALWMGVPTVSIVGDTPASQSGRSALESIGLKGFITTNFDDYLREAARWPLQKYELNILRMGMRDRFNSQLFPDPNLIAQIFLTMIRESWKKWCSDEFPTSFNVRNIFQGS
jgi:protein O-GlcNAc transferase